MKQSANSPFVKYWQQNQETFDFYIRTHAQLELGMDILKPLITEYAKHNTVASLKSCKDCIIDMLIWCRAEVKKQLNTEDHGKNKKGPKAGKQPESQSGTDAGAAE